jgi:hypothetical protein
MEMSKEGVWGCIMGLGYEETGPVPRPRIRQILGRGSSCDSEERYQIILDLIEGVGYTNPLAGLYSVMYSSYGFAAREAFLAYTDEAGVGRCIGTMPPVC